MIARNDPRHRRDRDSPAATCSTGWPITRRSSPGTGPDGQPPDPNRHIDWRGVDLLDAARGRRAPSRTRRRRRFSTSPARRRSHRHVVSAVPHLADERARHAPPARSGAAGRPALPRPGGVVGAGLSGRRRSDRRERAARARRRPTVCRSSRRTSSPMLACARRRARCGDRAAVQSRGPAPERRRSPCRASRGRSRGSKRDSTPPEIAASAISTRAAT